MAWGVFSKIGKGLKKAINWVRDKIGKPVVKFLKPITKPLGNVVKAIIPGSGAVVDAVSDGIDWADEHLNKSQPAAHEG